MARFESDDLVGAGEVTSISRLSSNVTEGRAQQRPRPRRTERPDNARIGRGEADSPRLRAASTDAHVVRVEDLWGRSPNEFRRRYAATIDRVLRSSSGNYSAGFLPLIGVST